MTYNDKLKMDPDALHDLAKQVDGAQFELSHVTDYLKNSTFQASDLGAEAGARHVGQQLRQAVEGLRQSLDTVSRQDGYLTKVASAIRATAKAQQLNEEDAKWGFDKQAQDM